MAHFSSIYETSQQQIRHFHLKYTVLGNAAQTAKYQGEALCISNIQDIFHITIHVIIRFDIFTIGPTYQDKRHIQRGNLQIIRVKIETEVIFNIPASNVHQASWKGKSDGRSLCNNRIFCY
jgi:hypothetical protein